MNLRYKEILILLYRFRFLTRKQIQELLGHKYNSRVSLWLNKLNTDDYIRKYNNSYNLNLPSIYSLGLNGRSYLKNNKKELNIKTAVLNRIWREQTLSNQFRYHCLMIADIYLALLKTTKTTGASLRFFTKNDLYGIDELIKPLPDTYFYIKECDGVKKYYFLDVFDYFKNQRKFQKRIEQYYDYYDSEVWQESTKNCPFPEIIFVCSDKKSYGYLSWYLSTTILSEDDALDFYLTTKEIIKIEGLTKNSLKKVLPKDD
jgi:DNA-binding MarR family transcriptional regulator